MADEPVADHEGGPFPVEYDVPQLARVRNAISGGDANFEADRKVLETISAATANGIEGLQAVLEALHLFLQRSIRVVAEADVRQFLHIGTTTPKSGMVHEHVLPLVPDARIVYASYDTTTLAHVHELRGDAPPGAVGHVHSPFDDPARILDGASATLDLTAPVAVVLPTSLNVMTDETAQVLLDALREALVPGSHMVMAQTSLDIFAYNTADVIELLNTLLDEPYVARTKEEVAHHLEGYDLLDPGIVPVEQWRSEGDPPFLPDGQLIPIFGAVGVRRQ